MTHWSHTHPKARILHRCQLCGRTINPGEHYLRGVGFDGTAWGWKECTHCEQARNAYDISWDGEYNEDNFVEWAHEPPRTVAEARAAAGYRSRWRTQSGALWPIPQRTAA